MAKAGNEIKTDVSLSVRGTIILPFLFIDPPIVESSDQLVTEFIPTLQLRRSLFYLRGSVSGGGGEKSLPVDSGASASIDGTFLWPLQPRLRGKQCPRVTCIWSSLIKGNGRAASQPALCSNLPKCHDDIYSPTSLPSQPRPPTIDSIDRPFPRQRPPS